MNIKNNFCGGLTVIALLSVANAFADQITLTGNGDYRSGNGGEFNIRAADAGGAALIGNVVLDRGYVISGGTVVGSANGTAMTPSSPLGFQTFCVEYNEYISLGGTYNASISAGATYGGVAGGIDHDSNPLTPTIDLISVGTAFLYHHFATLALTDAFVGAGAGSGYNYANGPSRAADAGKLQKAIWFLEEEIDFATAMAGGNVFLDLAIDTYTDIAGARANNTLWNVGVLNLGGVAPNQKQDQLILNDMGFSVPDGGLTLMLMGLGLGGLALMRRKLA